MRIAMFLLAVVSYSGPYSEIQKFKLIDQQLDNYRNELKSEFADYYQDRELMNLRTVDAIVFRANDWAYHILSQFGLYVMSESRAELWENAKVVTHAGFTIRSHWMAWGIKEKTLTTHHPTTMSGKRLDLRSRGFQFDLSKDELNLDDDVRMKMSQTRIQSKTGRFDFRKNEANFHGRVTGSDRSNTWTSQSTVVKFKTTGNPDDDAEIQKIYLKNGVDFATSGTDGLTLTSEELELDNTAVGLQRPRMMARGSVTALRKGIGLRMKAYNLAVYHLQDGSEEILLDRAVTLQHRSRVAQAGSARIQIKSGEIKLFDQASIQDRGDKLIGKQIIFYLNNDKVLVKQARGSLSR